MHAMPAQSPQQDGYLVGRGAAWFAFTMTIVLMMFDYIDRQVIVSLFPHLKAEWGLFDKQLGGLVSVVSVTVALGGIPIALFADRVSRVKSIVAMASVWSLATISCMFAGSYAHLFAARALVGCGEAGYGSVGAGLISSHFPSRMRGALMAAFFASASLGSVLGVMIGGLIAARFGWQAAFGVVGVPGLLFALLYLLVKDYGTVKLDPARQQARRSTSEAAGFIARALVRSATMRWVCVGAAAQMIVVSAVWSWLPSYLNRFHDLPVQDAATHTALVVLACAAGSVLWGVLADRAGRVVPGRRLVTVAGACLVTMAVLLTAFAGPQLGLQLSFAQQYGLVVLAGFFMTCTSGPVTATVIDVVHPGLRSTGAAVLSLFQNLFGLAAGPFITGALSDAFGLRLAMAVMPLFGLLSAWALLRASRTYAGDLRTQAQATEPPPPEPTVALARG